MVFVGSFSFLEKKCPQLVAIDSNGHITGQVMDFGRSSLPSPLVRDCS